MAQVAITNAKLAYNEATAVPAATACTSATDGAAINYTGKEDGRILLILNNKAVSGSINAKILKGNGLQGVEDLTVAVTAATPKAIVIESGKFVNVSGTNKGKVIVNGSTDLTVIAIELP